MEQPVLIAGDELAEGVGTACQGVVDQAVVVHVICHS